MHAIQLLGIDRPLAPVLLGTMTFGDGADRRVAGEIVEIFLAGGGNGIDTANGYAGGRSEALLADLLRDRRDECWPVRSASPTRTPAAPRRCPSRGSAVASWAVCAGCAPTTSTCCTCISPTGPPRSSRPWPRSGGYWTWA